MDYCSQGSTAPPGASTLHDCACRGSEGEPQALHKCRLISGALLCGLPQNWGQSALQAESVDERRAATARELHKHSPGQGQALQVWVASGEHFMIWSLRSLVFLDWIWGPLWNRQGFYGLFWAFFALYWGTCTLLSYIWGQGRHTGLWEMFRICFLSYNLSKVFFIRTFDQTLMKGTTNI